MYRSEVAKMTREPISRSTGDEDGIFETLGCIKPSALCRDVDVTQKMALLKPLHGVESEADAEEERPTSSSVS